MSSTTQFPMTPFPATRRSSRVATGALAAAMLVLAAALGPSARAEDPAPINPFGRAPTEREDAVPGYVEMSDGSVYVGQVYLTRDKRLKILDQQMQRQREVPLRVVKQIECKVLKEWMEKEWKFKELASDEKMYTGRSYPTRDYQHTITLQDGRTIVGPLSTIVYVQPYAYTPEEPGVYRTRVASEHFLLEKSAKGKIGDELKSLVYVKLIKLGDEAVAEGKRKAAAQRPNRNSPTR